ncbi:MAG: nucleotide-binding universal stress UspA family protein [Crocinitomicaceae bacterium]|jgi:nucleotide-binding universal stress UspA family protein
MKHIILPSDFSENAWKAMSYAADLYHNTPCKFYIINTYSLPTSFAGTGGVDLPVEDVSMGKESAKQLERLLKQFKELDHHDLSKFETKSTYGSVIVAIKNLEEGLKGAPIVVMGTKGATGLGKFFFGSTTTDVIKKCKSPVVCVPDLANLGTPKSIMFAMDDLGISSQSEVQPLIELAEEWDSKIATVHINDSNNVPADKTPEEIVSDYYLNRIEHSFHNIPGDNIEDELMHFAEVNQIDLIAMIKRDQGFWNNFFSTSLTKNMAFYSKIPLLILKDI